MLYNILIKILWLGYRLSITFKFFFKYFFIFKLSSIFYDYYLGFYPKIFNDQGFFMQLNIFYNFLKNNIFFYYFDIFFILFILFFYLLIFWPFFFEIRVIRDHLEVVKNLSSREAISLLSLKEMELKKLEEIIKNKVNVNEKTLKLQDLKIYKNKSLDKKKVFKS